MNVNILKLIRQKISMYENAILTSFLMDIGERTEEFVNHTTGQCIPEPNEIQFKIWIQIFKKIKS